MSRRVKSAKGKVVDFGALVAQNEKARAVGNVPMNARGDRLDSKGNIKAKVEDVARVTQTVRTTPKETAISDPVDINKKITKKQEPEPEPKPEPISKITRTRDDGSKYVEIEYDDGSMETKELPE